MAISSYIEEVQEVVRGFLVESNENLPRLDRDMAEPETRAQDAELASVLVLDPDQAVDLAVG